VAAEAGGGHALRTGASFASPHAAGVAALIFSVLPERSAPLVLALMRMGADDLGPPGRDAGYGFGRLNAGNSVQRAIALRSNRR
jgi:subtilisin family serine protease